MPDIIYNGQRVKVNGGSLKTAKPTFAATLLNDSSTFVTVGNRFTSAPFNLSYNISRDGKQYGTVNIDNISEFDASVTYTVAEYSSDAGYEFGFRNQVTQSFGDSTELASLEYFDKPNLINGRYYYWPSEGNKILEINPENDSVIFYEDASLTTGSAVTVKGDKLYIAPASFNYAIEFDTTTKKFRYWDLGSSILKFMGNKFVEAPNGSLYAVPNNYNYIIKLNPDTGVLSNIGPELVGVRKYRGPILANNGKIYGVPFDASTVIEIDPATDTVNFIGNSEEIGTGIRKWDYPILASNGRIYGTPNFGTSIIEIEPSTGTVNLIGESKVNDGFTNKWSEFVEHSNGKIYAMPTYGINILEVNPADGSVNTYTHPDIGAQGTYKWNYSSTVIANDKIYTFPWDDSRVIEFNPDDGSINFYELGLGSNNLFAYYPTLASNGRIYPPPTDLDVILEFEPSSGTSRIIGELTTGVGSFNMAGVSEEHDGKLYIAPRGAAEIIKIDTTRRNTQLVVKDISTNTSNGTITVKVN